MAIIPRDLLDQAERLVIQAEALPDIPEREALLRTATGRAYYAVYHEALTRARREGYAQAPVQYGSHGGLWDWWYVEENSDIEIATRGKALKERRTRADYRLRETLSLSGVRATLADARVAFDLVRSL